MKDLKKLVNDSEQIVLTVISHLEIKKIIQECIRDELEFYLSNSKPPPSELISRKVAASILGVSLPTLSAWTKQGIIPAYRIGSSVRYKRNEVEDSLKKVKSI